MTIQLSDLLTGTYANTAQYRYDLVAAGNNEVLINGVNAKLARSMSTMQGAQSAPTSTSKGLQVQMFPDGSLGVGDGATVANVRNQSAAQADAEEHKAPSFAGPGQFVNFRPKR